MGFSILQLLLLSFPSVETPVFFHLLSTFANTFSSPVNRNVLCMGYVVNCHFKYYSRTIPDSLDSITMNNHKLIS